MIAIDSFTTVAPSTSVGTLPRGLIARNSGFRVSPAENDNRRDV